MLLIIAHLVMLDNMICGEGGSWNLLSRKRSIEEWQLETVWINRLRKKSRTNMSGDEVKCNPNDAFTILETHFRER